MLWGIYVQIIVQTEHEMCIGTVWHFCTCKLSNNYGISFKREFLHKSHKFPYCKDISYVFQNYFIDSCSHNSPKWMYCTQDIFAIFFYPFTPTNYFLINLYIQEIHGHQSRYFDRRVMQNIDAVVGIQLNLSMSSSLSSLYAFIIDLTNGNTFHLQTRLILDA